MHNLYFIASFCQLSYHRKVNLSQTEDDFDVEVCPKKIQEGQIIEEREIGLEQKESQQRAQV